MNVVNFAHKIIRKEKIAFGYLFMSRSCQLDKNMLRVLKFSIFCSTKSILPKNLNRICFQLLQNDNYMTKFEVCFLVLHNYQFIRNRILINDEHFYSKYRSNNINLYSCQTQFIEVDNEREIIHCLIMLRSIYSNILSFLQFDIVAIFCTLSHWINLNRKRKVSFRRYH